MIKKAVLFFLFAPFLMVFSDYSHAIPGRCITKDYTVTSVIFNGVLSSGALSYRVGYTHYDALGEPHPKGGTTCVIGSTEPEYEYLFNNPLGIPPKTDEECSVYSGSSVPLSPSSANYLTSGGSVSAAGGACSVTGTKSVCADFNGETMCTVTLSSTSTGLDGDYLSTIGKTPDDINLLNTSVTPDQLNSFNPPSYLEQLPGQCTDDSSCVSIGDSSYLIDWETAPEWFEYVGSDGQTYSKPQQEPSDPSDGNDDGSDGGDDVNGGCFTNCYPGDNDSGGSDGGSDGGSTGGGSGGTGGEGGSDSDSDSSTGGSSGGGTGGSGGSGGSGGTSGGSTGGDSGGTTGGDSGGSTGGDSGGSTGGDSSGSTGDGEGEGEGEGDGSGWSPGSAESPWPEAGEGDALIDAAQQRLDDLLDSIQSDMSSMFSDVASAGGSCVNPKINFRGNNQELAYCEKIDQWSPSVKPAVLLIASIFAMFSLLRVRD